MPRKPRVEVVDGIYHIINRGNNKKNIFLVDSDKKYLLDMLREFKVEMGFKIYSFVLMDNHYHFILQALDEPLHKIMHRINLKYSKFFNWKNEQMGHVFLSRYKSLLVDNDRYMFSLLRYIHQNPVKAGVKKSLTNYKWSSDYYYRNNIKGLVDIDFVLDMISKDRKIAIQEYKKFIEQEEQEKLAVFDLQDEIFEDKKEELDVLKKSIATKKIKVSLDSLLMETLNVAGLTKRDFELIKQASRKRYLTEPKRDYIQKAIKYGYTLENAAKNIGLSESAGCRLGNKP